MGRIGETSHTEGMGMQVSGVPCPLDPVASQ